MAVLNISFIAHVFKKPVLNFKLSYMFHKQYSAFIPVYKDKKGEFNIDCDYFSGKCYSSTFYLSSILFILSLFMLCCNFIIYL